MAYSTAADVKEILEITETKYDAEITNCITDADARIDNRLGQHESSLPLSPVPEVITISSKYLAAALFRQRRDAVAAEPLEATGLTYLREFIEENYYGGKIR